ncbi:MAG: sensor histidine kinase [Rhizobiaceae bacterium]|nr:sensor histidine kinase [Rhizobiaceae bacterium]
MAAGSNEKDEGAFPVQRSDPDVAFSMLSALRNTAVSVLYQNPELRVTWAQNIPASWSTGSVIGLSDVDFLPSPAAESVIAAKTEVLNGSGRNNQPRNLEICVPGHSQNGGQWFALWIDADVGPQGEIRGIVTTAVETTQQKQREQTLRVLLREVSHRSRNMLAIVQSIAMQTGRHSTTVDEFLVGFRGRLLSLASSQDLVTSSNWRGADLGDLLYGQAARYNTDPASIVTLEGEKFWLNPNASLHVGLALHELIANSISYGALSTPEGHAKLRAVLEPDDSLCLVWSEKIKRKDSLDKGQKRFGGTALERVVPAALNGSARLEIGDGALEYTLKMPAENFEIPTDPAGSPVTKA